MPESKKNLKSVFEDIAEGAKATGDAVAHSVQSAKDTISQRAKSVGDDTAQGAKTAGEAANQGVTFTRDAVAQGMRVTIDNVGTVRQRVSWDSQQVRDKLVESIESSRSLSARAKRRLIAQVGDAFNNLSMDNMNNQAQWFATVQGLMAGPHISREISEWLQSLVNTTTSVSYETHVAAVHSGTDDVSVYYETVMENVEISQVWLNDLASYNVVELVAGSIGILAVALNWNNDDVEEFSSIVGSMGLSAVVSANPLLLIVTVAALAKAFHAARKSGDWKEFTDGLAKGGICTGAVLLATSLMSGPTVVVLLTGICVGILANQATKRVSFVEIGQFMVSEIRKAPLVLESAVTSAKDVLPTST